MPIWVVVMLAIIAGVLAVVLLLVLFFCLRSDKKKQPPSPAEPIRRLPTRTESTIGVRPKIPNPIYTINANDIKREKSISDTITTRKLSMMFDSKKRFSTAFSHKSAYFDFENSPLPRHKEYLDFNDIENIMPVKKTSLPDRPRLEFLNENPTPEKANNERTNETKNHIPVQQVFAEDEISFNKSKHPIYAN
ncbi:unnamed protein product [Caenorhabditis bovis]|uniref:Uncharacterized protein n=1 Tax=Caenorhabditis bovis TaxID=2654633 RepID=A0A8S1FE80_9PELO|nr:unnamed protein product [Caenorhabditis bovis]